MFGYLSRPFLLPSCSTTALGELDREWFGHANVSTTRLYDPAQDTAGDRPTFRVRY
jgi:hypothetical protein